MAAFVRVDPRVDIPSLEQEVLELWDEIDAFKASVEMRPADREYVFYDGPPFANGSPHYGHILAGVLKDVVPRYWTMRGYRVERRFGWDTHGLPVEMEVEKQLGISGPQQIADYGIERFNQACRALVETTADEWSTMVRRVGRWVDMDDDYKTMDLDFMESVWWVFRQLWDKGLIYQDFKVLPYSWGATTPLSNFEVNLGGYRDVDDPAITLKLRVLSGSGPVADGDHLLIWTTTPWTLPGNLAIAVGTDIRYVAVAEGAERHWLAESRLEAYDRTLDDVVDSATGQDLLGISYQPPFAFFEDRRAVGAFVVIASPDVTTEDGTGLVHMAPAYGEADFNALAEAGLEVLVDPVDLGGSFTDAVPPVAGLNIKVADKVLLKLLGEQGILLRNERIRHPYPFCYRTDTPLIYKAIPTWFIRVESIRERMSQLNDSIHWVPDHVGEKRFGNWLADARDWAVSRNRYWGSCIPVWICSECNHRECIGSIDELERRSGVRVTDLHKHVLDPITWSCPNCTGTMARTPEVLDCWFESGSMPYSQIHYPFENKARFEGSFPAQFIAEGLDQTRGWFYTLHVLASALFDEPAFRNCVVNGMILAEDGRKMSKSLRNYPDPNEVFDHHGADALRAFLINSPVLRAEPVRFSEDGVRQVVRTVLLPLWNIHSFFTTYAAADGITMSDIAGAAPVAQRPELDRWILSVLQSLIRTVNEQMEGYYLYDVIPPVLGFIDDLTNWYVRRSRRRFWNARGADDADKMAAFATLFEVLTTFVKVVAPVLPFMSERIYQDLVVAVQPDAPRSVHHCDYPMGDTSLIDTKLEDDMAIVRTVVQLGHSLRKQQALKVRQPLRSVTVLSHEPAVAEAVASHAAILQQELNVKEVTTASDEAAFVDLSAKCDFKRLGPRLGARMKEVAAAVADLGSAALEQLLEGEALTVAGESITLDDVVVTRVARPGMVVESAGAVAVALDVTLDDALIGEGHAREIISSIQGIRKELGLDVSDRVLIEWSTRSTALEDAFLTHTDLIAAEVLADAIRRSDKSLPTVSIGDQEAGIAVSKS